MKIKLLIITAFLIVTNLKAQSEVSGVITNAKGFPIAGANVYLEGTYDGASTQEDGSFSFETSETGTQTLVISRLSYESHYEMGDISYFNNLSIQLNKATNQLAGVTLTAGTFQAGDNSKASVLKPLDIVTTAGAAGDFVAALQTLPGTSTNNEDGRLFVRGGTAEETQIFIDGLRVFQPYNATANNIPTRGRFSPFLFKGITFSTGGYSAEYGQALSSVLLLNTNDEPEQERTDIAVMSVGGGIGNTQIWDKHSLTINTQYINLAPYETLIPSDQGVRWNNPYESIAGEAVYRIKGEKSLLKFYAGYNYANLDIEQEDINFDDFVQFQLKNNNTYLNSSYRYFSDSNWVLTAGASVSHDTNKIGIINDKIDTDEKASHLKFKAKKGFTNRFNISFGAEYFYQNYKEDFEGESGIEFDSGYQDHLTAGFVESDIFLSNKFAIKAGLRFENSDVLNSINLSPRMALAYKTSKNGQFSLAYGDFYQNPAARIIQYDTQLKPEKVTHYILNYQYLNNGKTFRAEAYYKDYRNLIKYNTIEPTFQSVYSNLGNGYAQGLDVFWRDNKSIENLDYWVSYSYLDTAREYRNFNEQVTPSFATKHNFSLVTKYWVEKLRSQVGVSYNYASGRPFDNPNTEGFMAEKTKTFNNVSLNWSYLIDQQKILYFSINNILGINNVNGYQYADNPNEMGVFERRTILPAADQFFFVGFFWTISSDKKSNQLDNL